MIEENDYYDEENGVIDVPFMTKYRPDGTPGYYAIPGNGIVQASERHEFDPALIISDSPEEQKQFPLWPLAAAGIIAFFTLKG